MIGGISTTSCQLKRSGFGVAKESQLKEFEHEPSTSTSVSSMQIPLASGEGHGPSESVHVPRPGYIEDDV